MIMLHLIETFIMFICRFLILVQEEIEINGFVELETRVVLNQFLVLIIIIDTIQLEHHNVRWTANPCLKDLALAILIAFEAFDFTFATCFPTLIQFIAAFVNLQLYRPHLVDILVCHL